MVKIFSPYHQTKKLVAIDLMAGKILWSIKSFDVIPQIAFFIDKQKMILLNKKGEIIFISIKQW